MQGDSVCLGLSGVVLPYPKYKFPEEFHNASRLTIYSTFFNSIEVNASFYKVPQRKTIERWFDTVPANFHFTFKLHQDFTHKKFPEYDADELVKFVETISLVKEKSGCILVQFPPSLKSNNIGNLTKLLGDLRTAMQTVQWKISVEFRDSGWYNDDTFDLLQSQNCSLVLHDIPKSAAPFITTADEFVYVRFHGPTGNYRGSYSEAFLHEYCQYVEQWTNEGKQVYVYFNNTAGSAFENGQTFSKLIESISGK